MAVAKPNLELLVFEDHIRFRIHFMFSTFSYVADLATHQIESWLKNKDETIEILKCILYILNIKREWQSRIAKNEFLQRLNS